MKLAAMLLRERAKPEGLWYMWGLWVHDELQLVCRQEYGERLGKLTVQCLTDAAKQLGFKVPLTGEYKIGVSWDQCH